ncbi:MAG TPA: carbamoyltransferase N-terminal domain-containing protein, partial [Chitinophagaceae bacterium]|nr:carbamoyltransferase N-terminal domain-containing protein [Chitinophagaceae bacterium]
MKKILGISAFYHDSAATLTIGGKIIAAAQEERFTRKKHTPDFPILAIKYCLEEGGLEIDELDAIVFYDKPLLKFERLLETYYAFAPRGIASFLKAIPVWLREKIFLKKMIFDGLKEVGTYNKKKVKLLFTEHHLSHAASAFFPSPFKNSAILTIDGVGEWCTASVGLGDGTKISLLKELNFPHSVGLLYSAFTYYLGFTVNSGEYKLMGLAPYGNPESQQTAKFIQIIKSNLVDIKPDGSIWLNQSFFNYATGLRMVKDEKWKVLFGFPRREAEADLEQQHCNLALAIQKVTEEIVLKMAKEARRITGSENLCMAGGVALNCVANGKLLEEGVFKNIYIQPAAGDAGGALGAALAVSFMYFEEERPIDEKKDQMFGSYLGSDYSEKEIEVMSRKV